MPKFDVDFSGIEDGYKLPQEGDYVCKVKSITLEDGPKGKYLKWTLVIGTGSEKGTSVIHNTTLVPAGLFSLRNTLTALGVEVPKSSLRINTDAYIGKIVGITISHREYEKDGQKKKSAQVAEIYQVVKGEKGWTRADQKVTEELDTPTKESAPKDDLDDDEIDI